MGTLHVKMMCHHAIYPLFLPWAENGSNGMKKNGFGLNFLALIELHSPNIIFRPIVLKDDSRPLLNKRNGVYGPTRPIRDKNELF